MDGPRSLFRSLGFPMTNDKTQAQPSLPCIWNSRERAVRLGAPRAFEQALSSTAYPSVAGAKILQLVNALYEFERHK